MRIVVLYNNGFDIFRRMEVTLIRHTAVDVLPGTCYGQTDVPLKDTFLEEARTVAENLRDNVFEAVYCSPLGRCVKLAEFCGFADAIRDERLMELNFGRWEMQRWDSLSGQQLLRWYEQWLDTPTEGGESFMDQYRRVSSFFDDLRRLPYRQVAVFTHGGVIGCTRVYTGEITFDEVFATMLPYGAVKRITL